MIRGRLTDAAGAGVGNARIELLGAVDGRRGMALDKGGARTRADGRFTLVVPRGASSRTLLLRYRRHGADTAAAQARLRLRVRAGVALSLAPRPGTGRRAVALAGRLVGRPLPRTRKLVELQARRPGHPWVTVRILRARLDGRFAARYTPARGGRRELRAVVARPPTTRTRPAPPGPLTRPLTGPHAALALQRRWCNTSVLHSDAMPTKHDRIAITRDPEVDAALKSAGAVLGPSKPAATLARELLLRGAKAVLDGPGCRARPLARRARRRDSGDAGLRRRRWRSRARAARRTSRPAGRPISDILEEVRESVCERWLTGGSHTSTPRRS